MGGGGYSLLLFLQFRNTDQRELYIAARHGQDPWNAEGIVCNSPSRQDPWNAEGIVRNSPSQTQIPSGDKTT